jgi:hypothetical protein
MLQAEIISVQQDFAPRRKQSPEHGLAIAVLRNAIDSVEKHRFAEDNRSLRLFEEVRQWFLADASAGPYSFSSICDVLDLDSSAVRQRLRLAPERDLQLRPFRSQSTEVRSVRQR